MSIFILKAQGIEPILIGDLGVSITEGIYEEILECNVLEKYRTNTLRGAAVIKGDYLISNTSGLTYQKYFKKIAEPLDFEPKFKDEFESLKNKDIRSNWSKILKILEKTDDNSIYSLEIDCIEKDKYCLIAERILKENEIVVQNHKFQEYENNFKGMYNFYIRIPFGILTNNQILNLKKEYANHRIRVDLETLKTIVTNYNLKISTENYNSVSYSKRRTNFEGKHSVGINIYDNNIAETMTFAEATIKWNLADSTLRKMITTNKLIENVDYRKSGKVWLITKEAMTKIYGKPKIK